MPRIVELSSKVFHREQIIELPDIDPSAVVLNGTAEVVFTMGNCIVEKTEVCLESLVCAEEGCQRAGGS